MVEGRVAGQIFVERVCPALIDRCLDRGYEPLWCCRFENVVSCALARKSGFEPVSVSSYYRLGR
jgi:hypothetical protein